MIHISWIYAKVRDATELIVQAALLIMIAWNMSHNVLDLMDLIMAIMKAAILNSALIVE